MGDIDTKKLGLHFTELHDYFVPYPIRSIEEADLHKHVDRLCEGYAESVLMLMQTTQASMRSGPLLQTMLSFLEQIQPIAIDENCRLLAVASVDRARQDASEQSAAIVLHFILNARFNLHLGISLEVANVATVGV